MRLLSLNVAIFEPNNEVIEKFLLKQNADILCLQEVTKAIDLSANPEFVSKPQIDRAAKNLKYEFYNPITILKDFQVNNFHKKENFTFDFGGFIEMGNYVKTKFEISKKEHLYVKKSGNIKITDWQKWPKCFSTGVQIVDLKLPKSKMLRVINYHGIWTKEKVGNIETLNACRKILSLAKEIEYPTIIAGDFNLFPDSPSMQVFYKDFISLVDKHNIVTTRPNSNELSHLERNVVDYILVSKNIKINSFEVLDSDVSDHLPLVLDFDI
jgi:endonuclease/exonuclease/phosphatase family metal-dependent hydrolase